MLWPFTVLWSLCSIVVVDVVVVSVLAIVLVVGAVVFVALLVIASVLVVLDLFNDQNTYDCHNKGHNTHIYHPL